MFVLDIRLFQCPLVGAILGHLAAGYLTSLALAPCSYSPSSFDSFSEYVRAVGGCGCFSFGVMLNSKLKNKSLISHHEHVIGQVRKD